MRSMMSLIIEIFLKFEYLLCYIITVSAERVDLLQWTRSKSPHTISAVGNKAKNAFAFLCDNTDVQYQVVHERVVHCFHYAE